MLTVWLYSPMKYLTWASRTWQLHDLQYAREKNLKIKLVPVAKELDDRQRCHVCTAQICNETEFLYNVEYEYNGVTVQAAFADQQFFFGKGAGGHPTGSAVLSDIAALRYNYQYEYKKAKEKTDLKFTNNIELTIYLRMMTRNCRSAEL
jgi:homoserine dehydrogenase